VRAARRLRVLLVAAAVAAGALGGAHAIGALDPLEHATLDARFALRAAERPPEVIVVAVDDVTFDELGVQWPFPRSMWATVTDRLHRAGAREIVFDVQFTEETEVEEDLALFDAIGRAGGAVLATGESDEQGRTNVLGGDENLREIGAVAAAADVPDEDGGIIRRVGRVAGKLETIAVRVAARAGRPVPPGAFGPDGTALIDFAGPPGTVRTVPFSDLYRGRVDPAVFAGRIVVLGASAMTLQDVHPTAAARDTLMAGPEIQANAISSALRGFPLRPAPGWTGLLATGVLILLVPLAHLRLGILASALLGLAGPPPTPPPPTCSSWTGRSSPSPRRCSASPPRRSPRGSAASSSSTASAAASTRSTGAWRPRCGRGPPTSTRSRSRSSSGSGMAVDSREDPANAITSALHGFPLRPRRLDGALATAALILLVPLATAVGIIASGILAWLRRRRLRRRQPAFLDGTVVALAAPLLGLVTAAHTGSPASLEHRERRRVDEVNRRLEAAVRARTADLDALQV
jgi:CHASE2 domain-containing sensor protein